MFKYYQLKYADLILQESSEAADICYHIKDIMENKEAQFFSMNVHIKDSKHHNTLRSLSVETFLLEQVCRTQVELRDLKQEMNNFAKNVDESITRLEKRVFAKEIEEKGYV